MPTGTPGNRVVPAHEGSAQKGGSGTGMLLGQWGDRGWPLCFPEGPGPGRTGLSGGGGPICCPSPARLQTGAQSLRTTESGSTVTGRQCSPAPTSRSPSSSSQESWGPARALRLPRRPHTGAEDPGPRGAHPDQALRPLPLTPSQTLCRPCLPALALSCSRSLGVGISHPYPSGLPILPACAPARVHGPTTAKWGPRPPLLPPGQLAPGLPCVASEPPDPGSRASRALLVTWAGQGASEPLPGLAGARRGHGHQAPRWPEPQPGTVDLWVCSLVRDVRGQRASLSAEKPASLPLTAGWTPSWTDGALLGQPGDVEGPEPS